MQFLDLAFWDEAFRGLMALLCRAIYPIISLLYNLFNNITQIRILNSEQIEPIYQRITMILTIVMVFYITFQFVKYVVQPDSMTDKEKGAGNIVYKMIIVIVLIAFVPQIFNAAYEIQHTIVKENVISKVILGPQTVEGTDLGGNFSATIFSMFYNVSDENRDQDCYDGLTCENLVDFNISELKTKNSLSSLTIGLNATKDKKSETPLINFDGLFAVIVGGVILWTLILYSIDVGARWAQLIYLQVIAPVAIIGYLSPKKDGTFQKWLKQCISTYLDLFLRIAVINIALLLCNVLLQSFLGETDLLADLGELTWYMEILIYVVLIMGVLMFAHKAPKMLSELFPKSGTVAGGNLGLSPKERGLKGATRVLGGAAGMATGAVAGAATGIAQGFRRKNSLNKNHQKKGVGAGILGAAQGFVSGAVGGATRGLVNGAKKGNVLKNATAGAKSQIQANQRFGNRQESGYGFATQMEDRARNISGMKSRLQVQEESKAPISRHDEVLKKIADTRSKIEDRAVSKLKENGGKGGKKAQEYDKAEQRLKDLQENNEVRSREFRVGRFKDSKTAEDEYNKAIEDAKASVNKSNFITQIPEKVDTVGYKKALDAAEASVDKNKFIDSTTNQFDQTGYDNAVALAQASVNKANFVTSATQQFDQAGYEAAIAGAVARVKASDYSVAYKTEAEAKQAYADAVKAKTDAIDRNMYATEADYNEALNKAAATVNEDMYIKGYATQEEADIALANEINSQKKIVSDAKDAAVEEYVENSGDGAIDSMLATLATEVTEYNKTASAERQVDKIDSAQIKSDFKGFSDYVKSGAVKQAQDKNTNDLIEINSEINRIKRQTDGSGINEGKK